MSRTKHAGNYIVIADNAVIEDIEVEGDIAVNAKGVVLRNVLVWGWQRPASEVGGPEQTPEPVPSRWDVLVIDPVSPWTRQIEAESAYVEEGVLRLLGADRGAVGFFPPGHWGAAVQSDKVPEVEEPTGPVPFPVDTPKAQEVSASDALNRVADALEAKGFKATTGRIIDAILGAGIVFRAVK